MKVSSKILICLAISIFKSKGMKAQIDFENLEALQNLRATYLQNRVIPLQQLPLEKITPFRPITEPPTPNPTYNFNEPKPNFEDGVIPTNNEVDADLKTDLDSRLKDYQQNLILDQANSVRKELFENDFRQHQQEQQTKRTSEANSTLHLKRQPPNGGYTLQGSPSAYVLVPPFREDVDMSNRIVYAYNQLPFIRPTYFKAQLINKEIASPTPLDASSLQYQTTGSSSTNGLPDLQFENVDHIQRFPSSATNVPQDLHRQSKQFAYNPQRHGEHSLLLDGDTLPLPLSFANVANSRPGIYPQNQGIVSGRAVYAPQFKPSTVDPVPDFIASRQAKSLFDSYRPNWGIPQWLPDLQIRNGNYNRDPYAHLNRHYRRSSREATQLQDELSKNTY